MKLFLKKNKMPIIIVLLLLCWVSICAIQYRKDLIENERLFNETVKECTNSEEEWCLAYKDKEFEKPDTLTVYFYILTHSSISYIQWLAPLLTIAATVWLWHKKLHSGFIKDELIRSSYKKTLKRNIFSSLKASLILPFVFLILLFLCYLISGHFNVVDPNQVGINPEFLSNIPKLISVYFLVIFLHSIFYSCIGLLFCDKNKNILITIVSAYLCFLMICIIFEIFIGGLLLPILGITGYSSIFNLLGIWIYCDYPDYMLLLVFSFILSIISFIILLFHYKNQEEVLLKVEK